MTIDEIMRTFAECESNGKYEEHDGKECACIRVREALPKSHTALEIALHAKIIYLLIEHDRDKAIAFNEAFDLGKKSKEQEWFADAMKKGDDGANRNEER